jgi:uncharacterized protein
MQLNASLMAAEGGACTLVGKADVIVNGKFAQFGGRMMASVSDVILAQFAQTFSNKAQALQTSASAAPGTAATQEAAPGAAPVAEPAQPVAAPQELNALSLLWTMVRNFFRSLFGSKT